MDQENMPTASSQPSPTAKAGQGAWAVVGPFTARDLVVFGAFVLLLVGSLLPIFSHMQGNLWNASGIFYFSLGLILPAIVVVLFVARRLSPKVALRIGSLSVDQFASVVASFSVFFFVALVAAGSYWGAGAFFGLIGSLGLLAATVLAPFLPVLKDDFAGRPEVPAHVVARNAVAPAAKVTAPKASAVKPSPPQANQGYATPAQSTPAQSTPTQTFGGPGANYNTSFPAATSAGSNAPSAGGNYGFGVPVSDAGTPATAASSPSPDPVTPAADELTKESAAPQGPEAGRAESDNAKSDKATSDNAGSDTAAASVASDESAAATPEAEVPTAEQPHRATEPIGASIDPASHPETGAQEQVNYDAFWFAVAQTRTIVDEHTGAALFTIHPGNWVLALQDRGDEFLVQNTDGQVGVLRELANIERGS
ncbi:hypothetical protein ACQR35_00945 [Pseudarthrobacter sp. J1738]|uniref:hypothetical protein n=1 Tax=Pseudarthrobacter sp. J1738 TaxID=3420446 RepID=UPI003D2C979F